MALSDFYDISIIKGLDTSLSMVSLEEAETYFISRVGARAWNDVSKYLDSDSVSESEEEAFLKMQALVDATRRINNLKYKGCRTDSTQLHSFPRGGDTAIPKNIKYAVCELAQELLDGVDDNLEIENLGILSQSFSGVLTNHDRNAIPDYKICGIPSAQAWRFLLPFLEDPRNIRVVKI